MKKGNAYYIKSYLKSNVLVLLCELVIVALLAVLCTVIVDAKPAWLPPLMAVCAYLLAEIRFLMAYVATNARREAEEAAKEAAEDAAAEAAEEAMPTEETDDETDEQVEQWPNEEKTAQEAPEEASEETDASEEVVAEDVEEMSAQEPTSEDAVDANEALSDDELEEQIKRLQADLNAMDEKEKEPRMPVQATLDMDEF